MWDNRFPRFVAGGEPTVDLLETKRIAQAALDAVGDDSGFVLAGSMAMEAHGMRIRKPRNIDLFSPQTDLPLRDAAVKIAEGLEERGYLASVVRDDEAEYLGVRVAKPGNASDEVRVDLAIKPLGFAPVDPQGSGMRVIAKEDLVCSKAAALAGGRNAKHYIDWQEINATLGEGAVDSYLATSRYETNIKALDENLKNHGKVDDAAFVAHGVRDEQLKALRGDLDYLGKPDIYFLTKHAHTTAQDVSRHRNEAHLNPQSSQLDLLREGAEYSQRHLMDYAAVFVSQEGKVAESSARLPLPLRRDAWQEISSRISEIICTPPRASNISAAEAASLHSTLTIQPQVVSTQNPDGYQRLCDLPGGLPAPPQNPLGAPSR